MKHCYSLVSHKGAGTAARFYVDGIRVSRERYEYIENRAYSSGVISCFMTRGIPVSGGKTRRINYSTAQY